MVNTKELTHDDVIKQKRIRKVKEILAKVLS